MRKPLHIPRKNAKRKSRTGSRKKFKIPFSPWHLAAYFLGGISAVLLIKYSPAFKIKVENLVALK